MLKAIGVLAVAAALSGCQTYQHERGQPIKLSAENISDIKASALREFEESHVIYSSDENSIKLGKVAAAKTPKGLTYLCGYVSIRQSDGSYTDERLFWGFFNDYPSHIRTNRAQISFVSRNAEGNAFLLDRCRQDGVAL